MEILQFFDGVVKNIDKNTLEFQFNKKHNEIDGLKSLKNYEYHYNTETNMLIVDQFEGTYTHHSFNPYNYNIRNGSKIKRSSLGAQKKMPLLFL